MTVDESDFRRHYAELSDDGLLSIDRQELVTIARHCFDEELASRGLLYGDYVVEEPEGAEDEFVVGATFLFPDEAAVARSLLRSFDIPCYLENEHTLTAVWTWSCTLGFLRLRIPVSRWEEVRDILRTPSAEELSAQAEIEPQLASADQPLPDRRAQRDRYARTALVLALICSPAVQYLRVFVAWLP